MALKDILPAIRKLDPFRVGIRKGRQLAQIESLRSRPLGGNLLRGAVATPARAFLGPSANLLFPPTRQEIEAAETTGRALRTPQQALFRFAERPELGLGKALETARASFRGEVPKITGRELLKTRGIDLDKTPSLSGEFVAAGLDILADPIFITPTLIRGAQKLAGINRTDKILKAVFLKEIAKDPKISRILIQSLRGTKAVAGQKVTLGPAFQQFKGTLKKAGILDEIQRRIGSQVIKETLIPTAKAGEAFFLGGVPIPRIPKGTTHIRGIFKNGTKSLVPLADKGLIVTAKGLSKIEFISRKKSKDTVISSIAPPTPPTGVKKPIVESISRAKSVQGLKPTKPPSKLRQITPTKPSEPIEQKLLTFRGFEKAIVGEDFIAFTATPEFKKAFRELPRVKDAVAEISEQAGIIKEERIALRDIRKGAIESIQKQKKIDTAMQKIRERTGKLLAKELPPSRIKGIVERVTGVTKTVNKIVTNEIQLLRSRLAAEKRGAKAGLQVGKREIRTAQQIKNETTSLVKSINSLAGRNIPPDFKDEVNAIMAKYDLHFRKPKTIKERVSRKAFVERLREEGEIVPIPDNLLDKIDTLTLNDLNVEDLRSIKDTIATIVHIGQNKNKLIATKEARDFAKVESVIIKQVFETGRIKPEVGEEVGFQPPSLRKKTAVQKVTESLDGYFSSHRFVEQVARTLDKFKVGPVQDNIIKPVQAAGDAELVKSVEANTKVIEVLQPIALNLNDKIKIPGIPIEITQEEALLLYLNSQNAGNLERLVLGNKLSEKQIGGLVDFLNKNHPKIIKSGNDIFDIVESFYDETSAVTVKLTGQRLGKVKGRYFPIITDRELSLQQQFREAKRDLFKEVFNRASVEKGFTKTRVGGTDAIALSLDSIFRHIHSVIHFNTHALVVRDVQKLISSPSIRASISKVMSPGVYQQFKSWIADVADPRTPNVNALEKAARRLKNNTTKAILGFKVTVSLLQGGSFTQTINEIGLPSALSGLYEYWWGRDNSIEFIRENSTQMKFRSRNLDRDVKAFLDSKEGKALMEGKPGGKDLFFAMIQGVDWLTVAPSWLGAYGKELKTTNGDIDAARREADRVIRITQPQGAIKDLASIARGRPFQKLWTAFYSHFSRYHNLVVSEMDKLRFADDNPIRKVFNIARSFWWLLMIPTFLGTMIRSGLKFKDREDFAKKYTKEAISYSFGGLIGIRDFARIFASQAVGQKFFGTKISPPGLRGFELLAKAPGEKELKDKIITGARGLGVLTGKLPEQLFITLEGLFDLATGRTRDLRRLFLSRFVLGERKGAKPGVARGGRKLRQIRPRETRQPRQRRLRQIRPRR